jgi:hypothetical protein
MDQAGHDGQTYESLASDIELFRTLDMDMIGIGPCINLTPRKYRAMYEIYPAKACIDETAAECRFCLLGRIESIGRCAGTGPGGRRR